MNRNTPVKNQKHACASCRKSKIRCLVDTYKEHGKCRRCYQTNVDCIFDLSTAPRQKRQRTDTRLIQLEKEVRTLKAAFHAIQPSLSTNSDTSARKQRQSTSLESDEELVGSPQNPNNTDSSTSSPVHHDREESEQRSSLRADICSSETIPGCVGSDVLPLDTAVALLVDFVQHILPQYPVVMLANADNFNHLRTEKPLLLFAMVTAASRSTDPTLFTTLHARLLQLLSNKVVIEGQRSLELVQAILISEVWYNPPDDLRRLNFHLWINIGATVAIQLRLLWNLPDLQDHHAADDVESAAMDCWRTAFAVYLSCSTVAISLNRPRFVNFSENARKALTTFRTRCTSTIDERLTAWIELQLIAEEVDELRTKICGGTHSDIFPTGYKQEFSKLDAKFSMFAHNNAHVINASLHVHYLYCLIKLHEVVYVGSQKLHQQRFTYQPRSSATISYGNRVADAYHIRAATMLVQSCHTILDFVLQLDLSTYLSSPTVTTVRTLYALKTLWALHQCIHRNIEPVCKVLNLDQICFNVYLGRIKAFFENAEGSCEHRVPNMALKLTKKLQSHADNLDYSEVQSPSISNSFTALRPHPEGVEQSSHDDLETVTTPVMLNHTTSEEKGRNAQHRGVDSSTSAQATVRIATPQFSDFDLMTMPGVISGLNGVFSDHTGTENDYLDYDWDLMATDISTGNW